LVQAFLQGSLLWQTDRPRYSVGNNRPHLRTLRCGLICLQLTSLTSALTHPHMHHPRIPHPSQTLEIQLKWSCWETYNHNQPRQKRDLGKGNTESKYAIGVNNTEASLKLSQNVLGAQPLNVFDALLSLELSLLCILTTQNRTKVKYWRISQWISYNLW